MFLSTKFQGQGEQSMSDDEYIWIFEHSTRASTDFLKTRLPSRVLTKERAFYLIII